MGQAFPDDKRAILAALKEQYGRIQYTYTTHLKEAHILANRNSRLKWIDIVLSAVTTGGVLGVIFTDNTHYEIISCIASAILLVISLFSKEARLAERSVEHKEFANKLWLVRERYVGLMTDVPVLEYQNICAARDSLQAELSMLYAHEPLTSRRSYKLAQKALKVEEEQYFEKEELDRMLPKHLRDSK